MSEPHSKTLHDLALAHFNEPMISFGELTRCIGYGETAVDCYIIVRTMRGKEVWNTCVGGYIFLNALVGQNHIKANNGEDWDDLTRLDSELHCGGAPKEPAFKLVLKHDDWEGMPGKRVVE